VNPKATQRLRDGWTSVQLQEAGRIVTGSTPSKARTEYYGGSFPFVKPPELRHSPVNDAEDKLSEKGAEVADVAPAGSVLVSCIGNLGKTGRATQPVAFNQQINAIIPNDPNASKWIFYAVQTADFASQLANVASATTIAIVNKGKFSGLRIPLAPEEEQRQIVAEIEKQFTRLEAGVAGLRRVQANLKRYRAAVLKAACEGKLVPTEAELASQEGRSYETGAQLLERILTERRQDWNGTGRYKEPIAPDLTKLPKLAEGWTWCFTDALFFFVTSGSRGWARYYSDDGPLFLRIGNLDHGSIRLDLEDVQHVNPPYGAEGTRTKVAGGDFLVSITADVGMIAIAPTELGEAYINQHVALARPVNGFNCEYLGWYLAAEHCGQKEFLRLQRGATKAGLGLDDIRSVPVPLPPLTEQQRIVAEVERRLSVVEELEIVVNANLQRATRLRQSILQRAFEGNLLRDEQENLSGKAHDPSARC
jgi:type I restriction enzyme, S subunit